MKFTHVAQYFDIIEKTSSRLDMTRLLAELIGPASPHDAAIICNLALGQLDAPYLGIQFQIASTSMAKIVATVLEVSDATIKEQEKELGDLGLIIQAGSWKSTADLTVLQVYQELERIAKLSGTGSQDEKKDALHNLLRNLTPLSAKFVVRIVIGKLRLGFSDMTLVDALSTVAVGDKSVRDTIENAYNVCADIAYIARVLKEDGLEAVEKMHIKVGVPIRPAAAERLPTARAIVEKIGHCIAQPKLDGFRLQIHVDKTGKTPKIHFYSRNLLDMSYMFPDVVAALQDLEVETFIAEGEAIVFDPHTGHFLPFQETVKRKRKHGIEEAVTDFPLQVFLFDLLYINGQEMLSKTHEERRQKLLAILKNFKSDVIKIIEEKEISTPAQLEEYFAQNIASGLEGLVVKKPDSIYQPGKRNFNWIKLKRQEEGHLEDTVDCVILGYYYGEGKRAQFGIGAFLVGVYHKSADHFETVAKIGTGLKDADWVELKKKCDAIAVHEKPKNVICHKDLYPNVWVNPEIVVIIRADEITQSPVHAAAKTSEHLGYALRFPRFMGYAVDKSATEATTNHEIVRLYQDQFVK